MKLGIPFISSFRPGREGIHQVLGDLESGIMETLWISVNGLTGRQLCESLQKKKHLAYTTVLTVIDRLVNKGLIKKGKNPDNAYLYTAAIDKEKFTKEISDAVVKGLMEFSGKSALLKVSSTGGLILPVASFANLDSKSLLESRVVRLIEPDRDRRLKIPRRIISATAILYFVLLISAFTLPENLFSKSAGECVHSGMHSSCSQMSPEECRKHCLGNKGDQKE